METESKSSCSPGRKLAIADHGNTLNNNPEAIWKWKPNASLLAVRAASWPLQIMATHQKKSGGNWEMETESKPFCIPGRVQVS